MAFSYSSNIITQTGTDTDLSGLSGLTGVTTTQHHSSGSRTFTSYRLSSSTKLHIEGDLTITPSKEILILDANVKSGGIIRLNNANAHLRIEDSFSRYGETTYQKNCAIRFTGVDNRNRFYIGTPECGIWFKEGNFTQNGGTIFGSMAHTWQNTFGNFTIRSAYWDGNLTTSPLAYNEAVLHIRGGLANFDVDGWDVCTHKFEVANDPNGAILNNVTLNSTRKGWSTGAGVPNSAYFEIKNYRGNDVEADFSVWASKRGRFINSVDAKVRSNNASNTSQSKGLVEEQYNVTLKVRDLSQNVLQGVKSYIIDQDSGIRTNWTITSPNVNYTNDRVYTGTTDVNGEVDKDILVGVTVATSPLTGLYPKDVRFTNRNVPIRFCGYEYGLGTFNFDATGYLAAERAIVNQFMLPDTFISESNKTTVDAYTELNNAAQAYDRAKSYLYDNFAGETSTIISRNGSQIDIGSKNLNIDGTAANAFAYSTDVTIKSSTFTGGATGTGTVTATNGTVLNGGTFNAPVIYDSSATTITGVTADSMDFTTAGTYSLVGTNIGTVTNSSGGAITLELDAQSSVTTNTGPNITLQLPQASYTVSNIESGSRLRVYNETTSTEIYNAIVNSTSYTASYNNGSSISTGDTIKVRLAYQSGTSAKLPFETAAIATANGWSVLGDQQDDTIYNSIGVDGSLVNEFTEDFVNNEVDIVIAQNFSVHRLYAHYVYATTLEDGIRTFFGGLTAVDLGNFRNNVSVIDLYLNNNTATNLLQTDNVRFFKDNGTYPARTNTTGGGGVDIVWRNTILIAETGVSGLTAQESAQLAELDKLEAIEKLAKLIPATV